VSKWIERADYSELRRFVRNPDDIAPHIETIQVRCFGITAAPNRQSVCETSKAAILEALERLAEPSPESKSPPAVDIA